MTQPDAPSSSQTKLHEAQHRLRNKLGIVMGSIDIVRLTETLSPESDEDMARARRACADMLTTIDLLDEQAEQDPL
ncbi:hypothetical protein [uncultured Sphingomonas sp.]|uniref:hypothetical protein n=1 Tax=uncultured Sphingomonas sp. TaxID=158754 RepID=UPI0025E4975B|nr:hypothetical protein [uncultured Sphingomonas sp.]